VDLVATLLEERDELLLGLGVAVQVVERDAEVVAHAVVRHGLVRGPELHERGGVVGVLEQAHALLEALLGLLLVAGQRARRDRREGERHAERRHADSRHGLWTTLQ